ncbi:UNVERIFIED_CONTAM: putative plastidic glucose transporter 1 [Sesamum calycinum]|uniref:Plastidic glucose transporter 1 n=1 Tax=Sesamum calycinum TaxID=2727403 RepID=A0AAW2QL65_9LAMI
MLEATPLLFTPKCHPTASFHPSTILLNRTKNPFCPSFSCSLPARNSKSMLQNSNNLLNWSLRTITSHTFLTYWYDRNELLAEKAGGEEVDFGWLPAFPHVLTASMSNFLFGYHIGVMNGPIVSIAKELGFEGNSFLEDLCAQAHSLDEILLGRFLVGIGIGVNTVLVPIYIFRGILFLKSQLRVNVKWVAPTKYRGSLGTFSQIGTCLGIIASLGLAIPSENDPHWWRIMLYIASVPGFLLALGMQFAVDSPRWLCKAGRIDDAKKVISNLWGPSEVDKAIEEFQSVIRNDGADLDSSWLELLQEPHSRGGSKAVAMFVVAGAISFPIDAESSTNLSILGTIMYIFTFAIGAGPVTGLIIPELSSSRTRGKILGFSFSVHWVFNFLVGLFFLEMVEKFGVAPVYAGFGGISLLAAAFAYYFIVETKGRSLEEIEMSLNSSYQGRNK